MADKHITIKFRTSERKIEQKMTEAKDALLKVRTAGIMSGSIKIDDIEITIEECNTGSM